MSLISDYKYCEEIIKRNSLSFYKAFSQLPETKANDIFAVYAFCRIADDIIDVEKDIDALKEFENDWTDFKKGYIKQTPVWRALANTFSRYDMNVGAFDDMIKGQYSDFTFVQPRTQDELDLYCYHVAGTVGLMILPVLSENHKKIENEALILGRAMQITNILRDIGEDFDNGRIYIPSEIMKRFDITEDFLSGKKTSSNFIEMWEYEAAIAEKLYENAYDSFRFYDDDSILPVLLSYNFYKDILNSVRKNNYDCLTRRNYTTKARKVFLYGKSLSQKNNIIKNKNKQI